jgi:hypothetical protein
MIRAGNQFTLHEGSKNAVVNTMDNVEHVSCSSFHHLVCGVDRPAGSASKDSR